MAQTVANKRTIFIWYLQYLKCNTRKLVLPSIAGTTGNAWIGPGATSRSPDPGNPISHTHSRSAVQGNVVGGWVLRWSLSTYQLKCHNWGFLKMERKAKTRTMQQSVLKSIPIATKSLTALAGKMSPKQGNNVNNGSSPEMYHTFSGWTLTHPYC